MELEHCGCRIIVLSHRTEDQRYWRPGVTIETKAAILKHLTAPPGIVFDTETASDSYGLKMGMTWINERSGAAG